MQTNFSGLALVLAIGAVGVAGYALLQDRRAPGDVEERLGLIEEQLARIERSLEAQEGPSEREPALIGRGPDTFSPGAVSGGEPLAADGSPAAREGPGAVEAGDRPAGAEELAADEIEALVDKAVAKKASEIQHMQDKKPSIEVFAKVLELSDVQRQAVEQEVLRGQREIYELLETPTHDGTIFMDELVEVLANGIARPGQDPGAGKRFFARVLTEKVPGSDETFAERAEAVKGTVRDAMRRSLSQQQYASFEDWKMDPTEIKQIEGSPWKSVEVRVIDRAKALGADIPDDR